ncbi:hypothetical protein Tamer19_41900 [Cupriavidus sp. TA19]|nr:hypothetical protein Tamer19_41900 [Cupriavidus sp. TA19]
MRKILGWVVGFVVVIAVGVALTLAGAALGVPTSIDLDGPTTITHGSGRYSYEEETESLTTSFGLATLGLSLLIGIWAGQATYAGGWNAGFTRRGWVSFLAWLMALMILTVLAALSHLAFRGLSGSVAAYAQLFIEVGATVGIGWACHQWWKNRVGETSGSE